MPFFGGTGSANARREHWGYPNSVLKRPMEQNTLKIRHRGLIKLLKFDVARIVECFVRPVGFFHGSSGAGDRVAAGWRFFRRPAVRRPCNARLRSREAPGLAQVTRSQAIHPARRSRGGPVLIGIRAPKLAGRRRAPMLLASFCWCPFAAPADWRSSRVRVGGRSRKRRSQ